MRVPSTLMTKPLFRPFAAHTVKDPSKYWVEDHPVGSYGVASLRGTSRSLLLDSSGSRFELAEGHASEALKLLLGGNRLPAWSFAAYCLRNYGFDSPHWSDAYGMSILIRGLRSVFRLDDPDGDFAMLFDEAPPSKDFAAWFEAFVPDTADGE